MTNEMLLKDLILSTEEQEKIALISFLKKIARH